MQEFEEYIKNINDEFIQIVSGEFARKDTGEIFSLIEVKKYIKHKIEYYNAEILHQNQQMSKKILGIDPDQRLINKRSKKKKTITNNGKATFVHGTEFNRVERDLIKDLIGMNLNKNEKLVYYVLREFITHPTNCIMINDEIPTFTQLEPVLSLTERSIRDALKTLQEKNLLKLVQSGHRKAIYINPKYYATGTELSINTLQMFGLVDCDDEKVNSYID